MTQKQTQISFLIKTGNKNSYRVYHKAVLMIWILGFYNSYIKPIVFIILAHQLKIADGEITLLDFFSFFFFFFSTT